MTSKPTGGPLADISNVSRISHRQSEGGKGQVSIAYNPDDSALPPPPPKQFNHDESTSWFKGNILSPGAGAGKAHATVEQDMKTNESLVDRDELRPVAVPERLTEEQHELLSDESGNGEGKSISKEDEEKQPEIATKPNNFFLLKQDQVEMDPTHGLGEPVISAPCLSMTLTEAVSISSAPKPALIEPETELEQSTALSQFKLGMCYLQGRGVQQDLVKAIEWFTKSAENGDRNAQFNLGVCYTQGLGVAEDLAQAYKYFRMSADQDDTKALLQVGVCYILGRGVEQSEERAAQCFRRAAEQGDTTAQYNLGVCLGKGRGVPKNVAEAALWYRKAAEQGDAMAQFRLALCLATGKGVERDLEGAVELYGKAAAQNHGGALFNLGVCYAQGDGVGQADARAVECYQRAAHLGVVQAQHNLALCLLTGVGVAKDLPAALEWYLKAAAQGDAKAQFAAGVCFETGQGTEKDHGRAAELYTEAVARGNVKAAVALGLCYKAGAGVAADGAEARRLFEMAAAKGNHRGMFHMGQWCATSSPADLDGAAEWYAKAAEKGNPEAIAALKALARVRRAEETERSSAEAKPAETVAPGPDANLNGSWGEGERVQPAAAEGSAETREAKQAKPEAARELLHASSPIPMPKARPGISEAPIHSPAAKVRCGLGSLFGRKKK